MKKGFGGPDSRIRLTKKYMPDAARITPMKKDRRIRLMKKSGLASNMAVPYFDPTPSQRASNEEEMPESMQSSDEYDSKMDQEINRIVNLIMNKYSSRQSEMIKRGGYIRLVWTKGHHPPEPLWHTSTITISSGTMLLLGQALRQWNASILRHLFSQTQKPNDKQEYWKFDLSKCKTLH